MIDISKFVDLKDAVERERGELTLVALVLREGSPGRWDVVVSALWVERDRDEALQYLSDKATAMLPEQDLISISRIVVLEADNPVVRAILASAVAKKGVLELKDTTFAGIEVKRAYILKAERSILQDSTAKAGV